MKFLLKLVSVFIVALFMFYSITSPVLGSSDKPPIPEISGESAFLMDITTGQTLYAKNPDKPLDPASTTKIMTGLIAIERGNLEETVTASQTMLNGDVNHGTRIYLEPGEQLSLGDLLYALLLNSANDAAIAIAEYIGGSIEQFAALMNQRAKEIGALNTTFKNPSGLTEEGHLTTARDLALIARKAYQNPVFREYVRTKKQVIPRDKEDIPTEMYNGNDLLWRDSTVTGIKEGYTSVAKNTLVISASRDGRELLGVILKSPGKEIYDDMEKLLDYGFANFENKIYKPEGSALSSIMVNETPVKLVLDQPILYTQQIGRENPPAITLKVLPLESTEVTEIEQGQVVTDVQVLADGKVLNVFPLKADSTVKPSPSLKTGFILWILFVIAMAIFLIYILLYIRYKRASYRRRRRRRMNRQMLTRGG